MVAGHVGAYIVKLGKEAFHDCDEKSVGGSEMSREMFCVVHCCVPCS